jgi:hypothetical protein
MADRLRDCKKGCSTGELPWGGISGIEQPE